MVKNPSTRDETTDAATSPWETRFKQSSGMASLIGILVLVVVGSTGLAVESHAPPNVLVLAIDDLNDWVGSFGGNPQTRTPNIDRFCAEGAVAFQNAYCPGPICGPSRSAFISGFTPDHTGVYGNGENMRLSPLVQTHATLPEYFAQHGYTTSNRGKFFHSHGRDEGQWAFMEWSPTSGQRAADGDHLYSRLKNIHDGRKGPAAGEEPDDTDDDREGGEFGWDPTRSAKEEIDGRSIALLLGNPRLVWDHPSVSINGYRNACVRDERWYLIRYEDGTEEFYDMSADPMQWVNLSRSNDKSVLATKSAAGIPA